MTAAEIRALNIHDNAFLAVDLSMLDALENISVKCTVE